MDSTGVITEADILTEIVDPDRADMDPNFARALLAVRFTDGAVNRIRDLLQQNNAGTISETDRATLERYVRVGQFLDLMQAKARLSLHSPDHSSQ